MLVAPKRQHFKTPPALIMGSLVKMTITHHKEKRGEAPEAQQCFLRSSAGASF